jgi:hypothetical protein
LDTEPALKFCQSNEGIHVSMPGEERTVKRENADYARGFEPGTPIAGVQDSWPSERPAHAIQTWPTVAETGCARADETIVVQRVNDGCATLPGCGEDRGRHPRECTWK